jgi:hypothetical protein
MDIHSVRYGLIGMDLQPGECALVACALEELLEERVLKAEVFVRVQSLASAMKSSAIAGRMQLMGDEDALALLDGDRVWAILKSEGGMV